MAGMPASRLTDTHICAVHAAIGEVAMPGARAVLVRGVAAARLTDVCTCIGKHASPIAEGARMVLVNGLPMARFGVRTIDGGIVSGEPSVLVGGATFSVPSFITIDGTSEYQAKVVRDLYIISTTPTGQRLFAAMAGRGRKVRIGAWDEKTNQKGNRTLTDPQTLSTNDPRAYDGTGIDAKIDYNPDHDFKDYNEVLAAWSRPPHTSPDVLLVHEMIHADEMMYGALDRSPCANPGGSWGCACSERRAMGLSPYEDTTKYPYSENTYRFDLGRDLAEFY